MIVKSKTYKQYNKTFQKNEITVAISVATHLGTKAEFLLCTADFEAKRILVTVNVVMRRHKYKKGWHLK